MHHLRRVPRRGLSLETIPLFAHTDGAPRGAGPPCALLAAIVTDINAFEPQVKKKAKASALPKSAPVLPFTLAPRPSPRSVINPATDPGGITRTATASSALRVACTLVMNSTWPFNAPALMGFGFSMLTNSNKLLADWIFPPLPGYRPNSNCSSPSAIPPLSC